MTDKLLDQMMRGGCCCYTSVDDLMATQQAINRPFTLPQMTDKLLDQIAIEEEVQQSYLDYAMSVIVGGVAAVILPQMTNTND